LVSIGQSVDGTEVRAPGTVATSSSQDHPAAANRRPPWP